MGSGANGSYGSGGSGSQPYAPSYHVVEQELLNDKKDPNIYNKQTGYFKNPLAASIQDSIVNGQVQMNGRSAHGTYTYVMDSSGNIIFGKRYNPNNSNSRAPHPTLIGGKDPTVQCAGMIHFDKGRITWFNNDSGHFRPNSKSLEKVETAMNKLQNTNPNIFSKNYTGGRNR